MKHSIHIVLICMPLLLQAFSTKYIVVENVYCRYIVNCKQDTHASEVQQGLFTDNWSTVESRTILLCYVF